MHNNATTCATPARAAHTKAPKSALAATLSLLFPPTFSYNAPTPEHHVTDQPTQVITRLLHAAGQGDEAARRALWDAVYAELHRVAAAQMAHESPGRTLQPTALVGETYLRLFGDDGHPGAAPSFANRRHFFAAAAQAMRRILVDDARRRGRVKRGGDGVAAVAPQPAESDGHEVEEDRMSDRPVRARRVPLSDVAGVGDGDPTDLIALDDAMKKLEADHPHLARVVELRFFAGLGVEDAATVMDIAPRTVEKYWRMARAWLHEALS